MLLKFLNAYLSIEKDRILNVNDINGLINTAKALNGYNYHIDNLG